MKYWIIVFNKTENDFLKDIYVVNNNELTEEEVIETYEKENVGLKVIFLGNENTPPPKISESLKNIDK